MITIRPERLEDFPSIRSLIVEVFHETFGSGEAEAGLVERTREEKEYQPQLSLVAANEQGCIVGHILFGPILLACPNALLPALALAPLGVQKAYRAQGIGASLTRIGLEKAKDLGFQAVLVQGDPSYYSRFGFITAGEKQVRTPFPNITPDDPHNMVLELTPGAIPPRWSRRHLPPRPLVTIPLNVSKWYRHAL